MRTPPTPMEQQQKDGYRANKLRLAGYILLQHFKHYTIKSIRVQDHDSNVIWQKPWIEISSFQWLVRSQLVL